MRHSEEPALNVLVISLKRFGLNFSPCFLPKRHLPLWEFHLTEYKPIIWWRG